MGSLIEFLKRETTLNALEKSIKHAQKVQKVYKTRSKSSRVCQGIKFWFNIVIKRKRRRKISQNSS